ncbi:unnamed protein product [Bursaphelenchus okinawaensis]|uniref:Glutathione transferase n=1 Tax=Bursaphelenchus okinawaensis TaxID=465554 RepID=A0A811JWG0_9BILA|nr:unnamed protein product [Bursaphelenchus okinawaensis]CAG9085703.1 unnamed protein product [Bursaphelenchus okinawaensis]
MKRTVKYELLSLPGWSRAEGIRMIFHMAGVEYDDVRLTVPEWRLFKVKASLPPEVRLPILRIKTHCIVAGTVPIARTLARQYGMYGESAIEERDIEEIIRYVDQIHDALLPIIRHTLTKDYEKRKAYWMDFKDNVLNPTLDYLERKLRNNDYFVSDQITAADLIVAEVLSRFVNLFDQNILKTYPRLEEHRLRIENQPQLQQLVQNRPKSVF